jgi:hypothetical protein
MMPLPVITSGPKYQRGGGQGQEKETQGHR